MIIHLKYETRFTLFYFKCVCASMSTLEKLAGNKWTCCTPKMFLTVLDDAQHAGWTYKCHMDGILSYKCINTWLHVNTGWYADFILCYRQLPLNSTIISW